MNRTLLSVLAPLAFISGAAAVSTAPATAAPRVATPTDAATYMAKAGASDLYEIQSSQLVLQSTQNPRIRDFAQMMITDHTQTTQALTSAAQSAGLTPPPPQLDPQQAGMISGLQSSSGATRDALYLNQQQQAHQMALALHGNYASHGDTPALKQAAASAAPIIQRHIKMLADVKRNLP